MDKNKPRNSSQKPWFGLKFLTLVFVFVTIVWLYRRRPKNGELIIKEENTLLIDRGLLAKAKDLKDQVKLEEKRITIDNLDVFYRQGHYQGPSQKGTIILLHGMAPTLIGTSDVWLVRNSIEIFAASGYEVFAPDLPGTPKSRTSSRAIEENTKSKFLSDFIQKLNIKPKELILFGASWSGTFAIPYAMEFGDAMLRGFVAVATVGSAKYKSDEYGKMKTPTLIIHGEHDDALGFKTYENMKSIPNHYHVVVADAPHAVFEEKPNPFHTACLNFFETLTK